MKFFIGLITIIELLLHACQPLPSDSTTAQRELPAFTVAATDTNLHWRNGIWYYGLRSFSGVMTEQYENGPIKAKMEYRHGRQHGKNQMWYEDGRLLWERQYLNGKKHGQHEG